MLSKLESYKSPGPGNIHSYILKLCAGNLSIATPLFLVFKQSLEIGQKIRNVQILSLFLKMIVNLMHLITDLRITLTSQVVKFLFLTA